MEKFWSSIYFGNTIADWAISIAIVLAGVLILRLAKHQLFALAQKVVNE